ncbi:MAG: hypothetical protein ACO1NV_12890 [Leptospira bouyouniensis]
MRQVRIDLNQFNILSKNNLVNRSKYTILLFCFGLSFYSNCSYQKEVPNDPLVQLFVINFANEYYSNSCKNPKLVLRKNTNHTIELKPNEKSWFRFSYEDYKAQSGVTDYFFKITKESGTAVQFYTNNNCLTYADSAYKRLPIATSATEDTYRLYKSDFESYSTFGASENGYYLEILSGNPNLIIRQY